MEPRRFRLMSQRNKIAGSGSGCAWMGHTHICGGSLAARMLVDTSTRKNTVFLWQETHYGWELVCKAKHFEPTRLEHRTDHRTFTCVTQTMYIWVLLNLMPFLRSKNSQNKQKENLDTFEMVFGLHDSEWYWRFS